MSSTSNQLTPVLQEIADRVRAWFLVTPDKKTPQELAQEIYDDWIHSKAKNPPSDNLVVIRADVVKLIDESPCQVSLIVPADAKSVDDLNLFKAYLQRSGSVIEARVEYYTPGAPYLSNGYISIEEARLGLPEELPESVRLTKTSPGDNPWG